MTLPGTLLRSLAGIVGEPHVLTGDATAGYAVDWTGRFQGHTPAVGGAVATNAGGLRVLRFGQMRAQLRGIEAVLADGTVVSHLAGLVKDNTGYDYPSLLAGSEVTLAVVTGARLRLVPRLRDTVTALAGVGGLDQLHALARRAVREVPGLVSAEFFTRTGLDILVAHAGLASSAAAVVADVDRVPRSLPSGTSPTGTCT